MRDYYRGWKSADYTPHFRKPPNRRVARLRGFWKKLILLGIFFALAGFVFTGLAFAYYSFNLPDPNKLVDRPVPESTKIFDRNGKLLYEIHGEAKRTLVALDQIPKHAKDAAIAVEDKNFYKHGGISFTGIARAILVNLLTASKSQGGSTITQQFVRNAVLTREKAFSRKFKEIALSLSLERRYEKDQILQLYLNEIPYGSNAYGIQAASQTFFGKNAADLTLPEAAYLAALPKAPTYYSPFGPHKEDLDKRADTVLQLMHEQGYLTKAQRNQAQNTKVAFREIGRGILAPHFVLYVQDLLAARYGELSLREEGLKVTTSLNLELQTAAEEIVAKQIPSNEKNYNAGNASLVAVDPRSGQILAMVGSRDYFDEQHDGAVNVALRPRQPGSSFKPYVYAAAFKEGMSPATMLLDVVTNFGEFGGKEYIPSDYDGKQRGPVSIRAALQGSLNIPAVKTTILIGVEKAIDVAENMGIATLKDRSRYGPSLVLGGGEVKLLEHVAAYGVFASGGIKHDLVSILKVEDKSGRILEEFRQSRGREVLHPEIAYQINHVLSDNEARVFIFGRNNRLTLPGRPAAAKTGTTQEYRDAWTIGYVPGLVAGVWVGNNDNSAMKKGADGSVVAAPIWNEFMRRALEGKPAEEFTRPEGIQEIAVDTLSGKLPTAYSPGTKTEIFSSFNAPKESDDVHAAGYTILHSEKPDEEAWETPVRAWAAANGYVYPPDGETPGGEQQDNTIKIKIDVPEKISAAPWKIGAEIESTDELKEVQFFLDGRLLASFSAGPFEYENGDERADGLHQLAVKAKTVKNKINQKSAALSFALQKNAVLLQPRDNEEVMLPANVVLETTVNIAPENVKFSARTPSGKQLSLGGKITKQQIGQIYHYTLNWSEANQLPQGSYAISAGAGTEMSREVVIKIP